MTTKITTVFFFSTMRKPSVKGSILGLTGTKLGCVFECGQHAMESQNGYQTT